MTDYHPKDPKHAPPNPVTKYLTGPEPLQIVSGFENAHRNTLAWSEQRQRWLVNAGTHWREDDGRALYDSVRDFGHSLRDAVAMFPEPARGPWVKPVKELQTVPGHRNLIFHAKTGLCVPESVFDADPMQLNVAGRVLDLNAGGYVEAASLFTKSTSVVYDPEARSERFDKLLEIVQPDPERRAYMQRCFGAGLSGKMGQRLIFVLFGPTGCGKSTLSSIVAKTMGSYATTMRHDSLTLKAYAGAGHTSELIPLVGARMAFVHELPDGLQLNASLLKTIVGGEPFSVSEKGKPHFIVTFAAKLYLVSNHPISLSATDDAAWARIQLIPFDQPIPNPDREAINDLVADPEVQRACLRWLVEGWCEFKRIGLAPPAGIAEKTAEQRERNALISEWLEAEVERAPLAEMPSEPAFRRCRDYLAMNGRASIDPKRFAAEMKAAGFVKVKTKTGNVWRGGSLRKVEAGL